ncbi:MAG: DnaJ domain-containing protein, partial [Cyanobacteriota bacterium]
MSESNYYETLKVSSEATTAEIKQAYRRLAKLFHPDSNSATADPNKIIHLIAAYEVLSDPTRRRSYDQQLRSWRFNSAQQNRQQRTAYAQQRY